MSVHCLSEAVREDISFTKSPLTGEEKKIRISFSSGIFKHET